MELKLFVLSDLHAFDSASHEGPKPSFFDIAQPEGSGAENPIRDLKTLIASKAGNLTSDYLVCCGDLGDRAHPAAGERAWREIQEIGRLLSSKKIIVTVGNHDVDSRHKHNDFDAKGALLELDPGFPFSDEADNCHFWTHHFNCFHDVRTGARFVVLNSSGYHGGANPNEFKHGRTSARTLRKLVAALDKSGPATVNVLICHHHPQKHNELKLGDYDDMQGGAQLLAALVPSKYGPWLVIHGHKHHPKLSYAQGGTATPVVLSAGSCSAILSPDLSGWARNQVYLVSVDIPSIRRTSCNGEFISWDWAPVRGWEDSQSGSGLPAHGGFGFRGDLGEVAATIANQYPVGGNWKEILRLVAGPKNMLPSDVHELCTLLKGTHSYRIQPGPSGTPILIEK